MHYRYNILFYTIYNIIYYFIIYYIYTFFFNYRESGTSEFFEQDCLPVPGLKGEVWMCQLKEWSGINQCLLTTTGNTGYDCTAPGVGNLHLSPSSVSADVT